MRDTIQTKLQLTWYYCFWYLGFNSTYLCERSNLGIFVLELYHNFGKIICHHIKTEHVHESWYAQRFEHLNICCIDLFREHAPRLCMSCKEELKALGVISGSEHSFQWMIQVDLDTSPQNRSTTNDVSCITTWISHCRMEWDKEIMSAAVEALDEHR